MEIWARQGREMSLSPNPYGDMLNQCVTDADRMGLGGVAGRNHISMKECQIITQITLIVMHAIMILGSDNSCGESMG